MAKININFDNVDYVIEDSFLSTPKAALKDHFSNVMNGSGAAINFDGTNYSIDATKLSAVENEFVTYLGTIAGEGRKVVVNGVEYSIESAKIEDAISNIRTVLNNLKPVVREKNTWEVKNWNGYTSFSATNVWTDGDNVYLSVSSIQNPDYVLNKETDTWEIKTWNWSEQLNKRSAPLRPWTEGNNIYRRAKNSESVMNTYVLNKETNTWEVTTFDGMLFDDQHRFVDGEITYGSNGTTLYIKTKETNTWKLWKNTIWNETSSFNDGAIWAYKGNVYYSLGTDRQYVLNKETDTWEVKNWNGYSDLYGSYLWSDGEYMYHSDGANCQQVLNTATDTWETKNWNNLPDALSNKLDIWTDGENTYISAGTNKHYILV